MPKSGQFWERDFLRGHPLFEAFEALAAELRTAEWPTHEDFSALAEKRRRLRTPELLPLRFVPTRKRSRRAKRDAIRLDELYDGRIALANEVPCLPGSYHDLFNALIFAAFPRAKRALHRRQWRALSGWIDPSAARIPGQRTREQDALTIFDEGGVVLAMTERAARSWRTTNEKTNVETVFGEVVPLLFGHALLEHLFEGHLAVRASALVCIVPDAAFEGFEKLLDLVDRALAERLDSMEAFREPRADSIFTMERERSFFGPPSAHFAEELAELPPT